MAASTISGLRIAGLCAAVPDRVRHIDEDARIFGQSQVERIRESTGVVQRPVTETNLCTSDLCYAAADRLLQQLGWERTTIDGLLFVTQTPDYFLPATSCILQNRLALGTNCAAFDINLGCSGYVYGLWLAGHLIAGGLERVLLLVGDTISRVVSPRDRATALLFGDAGTATALERTECSPKMSFELGSDGRGWPHLIVPAGSFRQPRNENTARRTQREGGNIRSDEDLFMDGAEIFGFTLRVVPRLVANLLERTGSSLHSMDAIVMHQANQFIIDHLTKRLKISPEKVPTTLRLYGNTSSASIPLTLVVSLGGRLQRESLRLLLIGFGVGWSWGAVELTCGPMLISDVVRVPDVPTATEQQGQES